MTEDQIINSLVKFALKIHHPYPIPVGDILLQKYHCEYRQKDMILIQIENYNLMKLIDENSGSEMKFTEDGLIVARSDNPIEAMNKLIEDRKIDNSIQTINIEGDIHYSQIGTRESKLKLSIQPENIKVAETEKQNIAQRFWKSFPDWSKVLIAIGSIAGLVKAIIELVK